MSGKTPIIRVVDEKEIIPQERGDETIDINPSISISISMRRLSINQANEDVFHDTLSPSNASEDTDTPNNILNRDEIGYDVVDDSSVINIDTDSLRNDTYDVSAIENQSISPSLFITRDTNKGQLSPIQERLRKQYLADGKTFVTIFRDRKYFWRTKSNLHIHIIEHCSQDCIEFIAYDTDLAEEAPRLYLSASKCYNAIDPERYEDHFKAIKKEITKWKSQEVMDENLLREAVLRSMVAHYLIENLSVRRKPFTVQIQSMNNATKAIESPTKDSSVTSKLILPECY